LRSGRGGDLREIFRLRHIAKDNSHERARGWGGWKLTKGALFGAIDPSLCVMGHCVTSQKKSNKYWRAVTKTIRMRFVEQSVVSCLMCGLIALIQ
jgi:hypothetical protein